MRNEQNRQKKTVVKYLYKKGLVLKDIHTEILANAGPSYATVENLVAELIHCYPFVLNSIRNLKFCFLSKFGSFPHNNCMFSQIFFEN